MTEYNNNETAEMLEEIGTLLEIQGENPFRIRAYRKAARTIKNLPRSLHQIFNDEGKKGLEKIPGIGKNIAAKIIELFQTGQLAQYQHLQHKVPPELSHLVDIRGLGAIRLRILHQKLKINNLEDLRKAAQEGKIRDLDGFGEKSEKNILKGIEQFEKHQGRLRMSSVFPFAQTLVEYIKQIPGVGRVEIAGSLRRRQETVGDLDILVTGSDDCPLMNHLLNYNRVKEVLVHGETKTSLLLDIGVQADIRLLSPENFGGGLHYFTGSKQHNIAMRRRAQERGFKLNEYGLFNADKKTAGKTEEELFQALELDFIPPELREDQGEIAAAEKHALPCLIEQADVLGDLHVHTNYSDGYHSLAEMAHAAQNMGYRYLAITDHSKSQAQAHGLDEARLLQEIKEIEQLNSRLKSLKLLKGTEVDILKDGNLDLSIEVLKQLDCVVASVHSSFTQSKEKTTARIIRAIKSGVVHIIGHPTARLVREREPLELDIAEIFRAAKEHNVAMELNAHGNRLDLKDTHCRLAKQMGVKVAISTDAHSALHLPIIQYGIFTARRGWLEADDVINTWGYDRLIAFLKR